MLLWLNHWVYGFAAVTMQGQSRPLCISSALAFQSFLTALFIFHIITVFHASFGENSLRSLKKYGSLSLNKASTERRQCLYNPAHAATWKGTVIYFTSSTQGSLNIFHILHGYKQTFAQESTGCSIPSPLSCLWICPMLRRHAWSTEGRLFHHCHCHSLESLVVAKREYAVANYEMLFQPSLKAGSPLLQFHVLQAVQEPHGKTESDQPINVLIR